EERRQTGVAVAGVVADHGQVRGALPDQRVDEPDGHAGHPESADQDRGTVGDPRDGVVGVGEHAGHRALTFSRTTARPWPTPMQMAATPHRSRRSRSTWASVPRTRPPEAPSGWPMAMAPPLVLTISGSTFHASRHTRDWTANASLSSTAP